MRSLLIVVFSLLLPMPVWSQGLMEFGDLRAGAAGTGAGAGLSAGLGHKNAVNKSFAKITRTMTSTQKAAFEAQTQAINKYWSAGCQYEMAKQWSNAEKSFVYVLQVVTLRDGAKSPSRVPVLQKLVTTTRAQKKYAQANNYQKAIVDFQKGTPSPEPKKVSPAPTESTQAPSDPLPPQVTLPPPDPGVDKAPTEK